jgi:hypothetical protein
MNAVQKMILLPYEEYERCLDRKTDRGEVPMSSENDEAQVGHGLSMDIIMAAIPKQYQYRVKAILSHIMKDPRKILGWNHRGELHFRGETISGSHVTDLLKDSQYAYKNLVPLGIGEFYQGLRDMNIPQSLISNDQRRENNIRPPGIPHIYKERKKVVASEKKKWITV